MKFSLFPHIFMVSSIVVITVEPSSESDYHQSTPSSSITLSPVIRHPGTCTYQRSQPACTFSLLCYLAGGVPIEGCGGDLSQTCCLLYNPQRHYQINSIPLPSSLSSASLSAPQSPSHHQSYLPSNLQISAENSAHPSHYYGLSSTVPTIGQHIHNTIRRTRPTELIKSPFKEVSNRQMYSRSFVGEDFCGQPSAKPTNRIIGGQSAYFGEFPWQVHIKITKHQCGGALVNKNHIVTAAHCIYQAPIPQLNVIIGAFDIEDQRFQDIPPQYFGVEEVKLHPNFRFSASHPDRFDIAVLRLDRPVHYNDNVLPVCLPVNGFRYEGWHGFVTGWGKTDPALSNRYGTRLLQKVEVPIINNEECEKWHRTKGIDLTIFPEMMCAGYEDGQKDACVGDSGGPLVVNVESRWTLAGITSAGFGCAQTRQPGIYHRVSHSVDWILANIS